MADEKAPPVRKTPTGGWPVVRSDAGARVLVDRIDALGTKIESFQEDLKGVVTHKELYMSIVGILGLVAVIVNLVMGPTREAAREATAAATAAINRARAETAEQLQPLKAEAEKANARIEGLYRFLIEGRSRGRVAQEVKRRTEEEPQ